MINELNKNMVIREDTNGLTARNISRVVRSVAWGDDLSDEQLLYAIKQSTHIVTAWENDRLIGIARSMDDGIWSSNIDLVIVDISFQHRGVGSIILGRLIKSLENIKYISVSPNEKSNADFYIKNGFNLVANGVLLQIVNK